MSGCQAPNSPATPRASSPRRLAAEKVAAAAPIIDPGLVSQVEHAVRQCLQDPSSVVVAAAKQVLQAFPAESDGGGRCSGSGGGAEQQKRKRGADDNAQSQPRPRFDRQPTIEN